MTTLVKIGIAGLGTVGGGVLKIIRAHGDLLEARSGARLTVTAVSGRDRAKDRGVPLDGLTWYDDATAMAEDPDVDIVLELIGGSDGVARELCEKTLRSVVPRRFSRDTVTAGGWRTSCVLAKAFLASARLT